LLKRVDQVADFPKAKRDPTKEPEKTFLYIDISAIDVSVGTITNPQDVEGAEAPSRARKVVQAFDLLISTCRPTRGAIAVVPVGLHDEIASTGFSVMRAKAGINPFYLHFALRLPSTLEQFRKWSTGSSYPAILDSDVAKTLIPVPLREIQDQVAEKIIKALLARNAAIESADTQWALSLAAITGALTGKPEAPAPTTAPPAAPDAIHVAEIEAIIAGLPPLTVDANGNGNGNGHQETLFDV